MKDQPIPTIISQLAHDTRSPLATARALVETLELTYPSDEIPARALTRIDQSFEHFDLLVLLIRLHLDVVTPTLQFIQIADFVNELRKVNTSVAIGEVPTVEIMADTHLLKQVLTGPFRACTSITITSSDDEVIINFTLEEMADQWPTYRYVLEKVLALHKGKLAATETDNRVEVQLTLPSQ